MDYIALGRRIRNERLRLGITQEKLAEDVNISASYIGQIERGERSLTLDTLVQVANRLSVTIDFLLSDYVPPQDESLYNSWCELMNGKTPAEKALAVNMIRLMFTYLDENH
jgi:transcriptional regulator with XRE-family HTH domain